ncbi:MAG: hypothetical protein EZS28_049100, partial [Streblomastix strix]
DQNAQEQQEKQLEAQLGERILTLKCLGAICEVMAHNNIDQTSQVHDQQLQRISTSLYSPFPSHSLACGALELLNLFLIETPNIFELLPSFTSTDLIQSLTELVRFQSKVHISKKTDMQSMRIRENSSSIFGLIWPHCDEQTEKWIIQDLQLGLKLLEAVSCAGGCLEESDGVTKDAVENLSLIMTIVKLGNNEIKANPDLLKLINEEIIQEGGLNEIESHLFPSKENRDQEIIVDTRRLQMVLNMVRMDITNALIF